MLKPVKISIHINIFNWIIGGIYYANLFIRINYEGRLQIHGLSLCIKKYHMAI